MFRPNSKIQRRQAQIILDNRSIGIGIDIGMTYFGAAASIIGGPGQRPDIRLIDTRIQGSDPRSPSKLFYPDGGIVPLVGISAENAEAQGAKGRFHERFKRFIGLFRPFDPHPAYALTADLIRSAHRDVEAYLLSAHFQDVPTHYAFSHPGHWEDAEKKDFKKAIKAAGLQGDRLIAEPLAAALGAAYTPDVSAGMLLGENVVLVCDLGGGTFDLALVSFSADGTMDMKNVTGGNQKLGISDLDQVLGLHIYDKTRGITDERTRRILAYAVVSGDSLHDAWKRLPLTESMKASLLHKCEEIKIAICNDLANDIGDSVWSGLWDGSPYILTINDVAPLLAAVKREIKETITQYLRDAEKRRAIAPGKITHVLLTGGGVNLPGIGGTIKEILPNVELLPIRSGTAKVLVQRGTAVYAGNPDALEARVCNSSYGIRAYEAKELVSPLPEGAEVVVIERRRMMLVPVDKTFLQSGESLSTKPIEHAFKVPKKWTTHISMEIFESAPHDHGQNRTISIADVELPPNTKQGDEFRCRFALGHDGLMEVKVLNPRTKKWDLVDRVDVDSDR